jgi:hypothetical protein
MRPLREREASTVSVFIETRTAAQAARDAVTLHPDMKVLSVTRAVEEAEVHVAPAVPLARAASGG